MNHNMISYLSSPTFVWWDITYQCNLKCKHCYSNSGKKAANELDLIEIKKIIDQLSCANIFYIYFLGGEPLIRKDIFEIFDYTHQANIGIMTTTNGWLVTKEIANKLKNHNVGVVRVSIDGATAETHDKIRGVQGSFGRAVNAVELLKKAGISVVGINMTVMKDNIIDVDNLIDMAFELGVNEMELVQVSATGRGNISQSLDVNDILQLRTIVSEKKKKYADKMQITSSEEIDELPCSKCIHTGKIKPIIMGCNAGRTSLNIDPSGNALFCLLYRKPIADLTKENFLDVWHNSHILHQRRSKRKECEGCLNIDVCSGLCPLEDDITKMDKMQIINKKLSLLKYVNNNICSDRDIICPIRIKEVKCHESREVNN